MSQLKLEDKQATLASQQTLVATAPESATVHELLDAINRDLRRYAEQVGVPLVAL